jgi:hypothetical protein
VTPPLLPTAGPLAASPAELVALVAFASLVPALLVTLTAFLKMLRDSQASPPPGRALEAR